MRSVFLDFATVSRGDLDMSRLERALPGLELRDVTADDAITRHIAECEIVLVNKLRLTRERLAAAPHLRLITVAATGTNNVDLEAARERGIAVANVRDYCTTSVTQHVLSAILLLTHHLCEYGRLAADGTWGRRAQFTMLDFPIRELCGRVLGIIGHGTLGRSVARAAEAGLGMSVLIANRPGGERLPERVDLHELLPRVDVLSLHCPLTPATHHLIGARELALMKPDALLVNTARGALVDASALAEALKSRRIAGAAIDVLTEEPPVRGGPLVAELPNLLLTPHIAWSAREARQRCLDEVAANVESFLRGESRNRVV